MGRADDEAQLEYIRQWREMKEEEEQKRAIRSFVRKSQLNMAKTCLKKGLFKDALGLLIAYFKSFFKKAV